MQIYPFGDIVAADGPTGNHRHANQVDDKEYTSNIQVYFPRSLLFASGQWMTPILAPFQLAHAAPSWYNSIIEPVRGAAVYPAWGLEQSEVG